MKCAVKIYRILKPVAIYTSYLFTLLTMLYLAAATAGQYAGVGLLLTPGLLWAFFFLSLGSAALQRIFFGAELLRRIPYRARFALYVGLMVLWGVLCLYVGSLLWIWGSWYDLMPALLTGLACCAGVELFNRRRTRMYNKLLEQYKKRSM